jgi:hypothetical protein
VTVATVAGDVLEVTVVSWLDTNWLTIFSFFLDVAGDDNLIWTSSTLAVMASQHLTGVGTGCSVIGSMSVNQ